MRGNDPKNFEENYCEIPIILRNDRAHNLFPYQGWAILCMGLLGFYFVYKIFGKYVGGTNGLEIDLGIFSLLSGLLLFSFYSFYLGFKTVYFEGKLWKRGKDQLDRPWEWDYAWNTDGISGGKKRTLIFYSIANFMGVAFFTLLACIFLSARELGPKSVGLAMAGLAIVCIFYLLKIIVSFFLQTKKYGKSKIVFKSFPFLLGESLSITLQNLPLNDIVDQIELNLRFIKEDFSYGNFVVCHQYYLDKKFFTAKDFNQGKDLQVEWNFPDDPEMTTQLSHRPAKYWQLEVKGQTSNGEYLDWFLLPIYSNAQRLANSSPFQRKKPARLEDNRCSPLKRNSRQDLTLTGLLVIFLFIAQILIFVNGDSLGYWKYVWAGIVFASLIGLIIDWLINYKNYLFATRNKDNNKILWEFDFPMGVDGVWGYLRHGRLGPDLFILLFTSMLLLVIAWSVFVLESIIFSILGVVVLLYMIYMIGKRNLKICQNIIQLFSYGKSKLNFDKFPFFLGDSLKVRVSGLPPKDTIKDLIFNLRVIQEDNSDYKAHKFFECFFDQKKFSMQDLDSNGDLPIEWPLPDNPEFTTNLSERPAKYWELEVKAETSGIDYHERFLLPIYAKA
jgi:hypothetical protein